jgi:hypothetical protein
VDDCESSFGSKSKEEKAVFYDGLRYAILGSMTGVNENNIKNLTANCIVRRLDTASVSYWRRLAESSSSMLVSYFVKVRNPKTNYQNLSQQLQSSVESGKFAKLLMNASTLYDIPAFRDVTSYNITVEDKSPTLSPTSTPSPDPTTTPSSSPTTSPESSSRKDSTEAIIISILVLVACLIVVVVISVVIVILKITAVVIHPTVAAAAAGGGGGRYETEDMI